jgi:hypothetical protein
MADRKQTPATTPQLDERLVEMVRQEVRLQVAEALEKLVAELRHWAASAPGSASAGAVPGAGAEGIDKHTIVVLSAAVSAVLRGRPARISRITFLNQNTISAWAEAGRMGIHNSHRLGRTI